MNPMPTSRVLRLFLVVMSFVVTGSTASAQFFGPPGFGYGYGPQISITLPAPGFVAPPTIGWGGSVVIGGPGYPPPFGFSPRHIARRHAMMERMMFGYPYPAPYVLPYAVPPHLDAPYLEGPYLGVPVPYAFVPEIDIILERPPLGAVSPLPPLAPFPGDPEVDFPLPILPSAAGAFAASASRLTNALSQRENGEVWIDFLQSGQLAAMAEHGQLPSDVELRNLTARYRGVLANPDLAWLVATDGFEDTLAGLSAITNMVDENQLDPNRNGEIESEPYEPEVGILPAPLPEPAPATTSL